MTAEPDHPQILALVELYDRGPGYSLAIGWTKGDRVRMDTVGKLVKIGASAVSFLIDAMGFYAQEMRSSTSVELGIHPMRPTYFQSVSEYKNVDAEIHDRLRKGWPNLCHGPAIALSQIGTEAVEPTIKAVSDQDCLAAVELLWALGEIGDKRALPLLRRTSAWWNFFGFPEAKQMAKRSLNSIAKIV
jgi:hypothetical protein